MITFNPVKMRLLLFLLIGLFAGCSLSGNNNIENIFSSSHRIHLPWFDGLFEHPGKKVTHPEWINYENSMKKFDDHWCFTEKEFYND